LKRPKEMLRASRVVSTSKRGFATVVDAASGFKVAAVDNGQPSSSVTVLLKAGSRYQSKPGVAHALSNFAFKVCVCVSFLFPHLHKRLGVALRTGDGCVRGVMSECDFGVHTWMNVGAHSFLPSAYATRNKPHDPIR
jgi:hypothetical protein